MSIRNQLIDRSNDLQSDAENNTNAIQFCSNLTAISDSISASVQRFSAATIQPTPCYQS